MVILLKGESIAEGYAEGVRRGGTWRGQLELCSDGYIGVNKIFFIPEDLYQFF